MKLRILGIESSCDDTSVALIEGTENSVHVVKEATRSQINIHKLYGGVVPEVAAREHADVIVPLIKKMWSKKLKPDAIAVTAGPGLITSLMIGVHAGRTLSALTHTPLISINHLEGHIYSNWLAAHTKRIEFPALCLVVSGGHTELILMRCHLQYKKLGATRDDAAGEAFDKIAKLIGFEYPGGPKISLCAQWGNPATIAFPRPMIDSDDFDFSFSGLKTAALYYVRAHAEIMDKKNTTARANFCASFEKAIVDVVVAKTIRAAQQYKVKTVLLCGGVAANNLLRSELKKMVSLHVPTSVFRFPTAAHCMDNAAMIATAGYFKFRARQFTTWQKMKVDPEWEL